MWLAVVAALSFAVWGAFMSYFGMNRPGSPSKEFSVAIRSTHNRIVCVRDSEHFALLVLEWTWKVSMALLLLSEIVRVTGSKYDNQI